jgi:cellulose 1,4-beta-cellobiosidase
MTKLTRILGTIALVTVLAVCLWPATPHSITLTWTASPSPNVTYNVYRATVTGGPYTLLGNSGTNLTFPDTTGIAGTKYFYVVTAVDTLGNESVNSNEASATFLGNPVAPAGVTAVPH